MQHRWNWDHIRVFMALHRGGTLASAARTLRQDATTVGRRVAGLEEAVGAPLFIRTTTCWELSELGQVALVQAEAMEAAALGLERAVASQHASVHGTLRLACVGSFAEDVLLPWLLQFRAAHPGVDLELVTSATLADLCRREADIAVRFQAVGKPPPTLGGADVLLARRVGVASLGLFASDAYLSTRTAPSVLGDLAEHWVIGRDERGADVPGYRWLQALEQRHRPTISLRCNPFPATRAAVEAGFGIGALGLQSVSGRPHLRRLLPGVAFSRRAIWLVVHRDLRKVARVAALSDFLASKIRGTGTLVASGEAAHEWPGM